MMTILFPEILTEYYYYCIIIDHIIYEGKVKIRKRQSTQNKC